MIYYIISDIEAIKLFSCSPQMSMKFMLLINVEMPKFCFFSANIYQYGVDLSIHLMFHCDLVLIFEVLLLKS